MAAKVVVTGVGLCTSVGATTEETWHAITRPIFNTPSPLAGEGGRRPDEGTPHPPFGHPLPQGERGKSHKAKWLAFSAVQQALVQAELWRDSELTADSSRVACTFSASKPLFIDPTRPDYLPPDEMTRFVARQFGVQGELRNVIAACATGVYSVALGAQWIEQGICDCVIAGSVEPPAHPLIVAGFEQMGVLSSENVMRPFDRARSGFVMGHGAGAIVLESETHARARGHAPLAWISGWGLGADAHSAVAFNSQGGRIADVIERARRRAGVNASHIRHVNAHGTATKLNDPLETLALRRAFGRSAENLMISATKSTTGHLLGAAGSVEFILTVLALREQFVPPTATLEQHDPECGLDFTPRQGRAAAFEHALSLSYGFGGPIGALIVHR
jgi:3-oxoacyl-[acyl-carrier-protein] synthase II